MRMRKSQKFTGSTVTIASLVFLGQLVFLTGCTSPEPEPTEELLDVTVYEGARLIVGDGSNPIENATFIVEDTRLIQVVQGQGKLAASVGRDGRHVEI